MDRRKNEGIYEACEAGTRGLVVSRDDISYAGIDPDGGLEIICSEGRITIRQASSPEWLPEPYRLPGIPAETEVSKS